MSLHDVQHQLEAAILEDRYDPELWLVYADLLLQQGDPRGEIVSAYASKRPTTLLQVRYEPLLMGRFADELAPYAWFSWRMGFWKAASVSLRRATPESPSAAEIVTTLLEHPSARFLRSLTIEHPEDWVDVFERLQKAQARPSLWSLHLIGRPDRAAPTLGDVRALLGPVFPNAQRMVVVMA
ncbi:MAG: hypothetical protein KTR31_01595 [Myxococcales bacterium]|nr:hypothetical protein [Myxococcales bacterium]